LGGWRLGDADHRYWRHGRVIDLSTRSGAFGDRDRLGLDWLGGALGGCLLGFERRLGEQSPEAAREVAFETPQRALPGFALGLLASEVLLGGRVVLGAGDRDRVQRPVELAVPAAVKAVLGSLP
jgi:hypothetical protein